MFTAFYAEVVESTEEQKRCCDKLLELALGASRLHRRFHLQIMRQAEAHVAACDYNENKAITSQGPGGDLFFVLRTYRHQMWWRVSG